MPAKSEDCAPKRSNGEARSFLLAPCVYLEELSVTGFTLPSAYLMLIF